MRVLTINNYKESNQNLLYPINVSFGFILANFKRKGDSDKVS